MEWRRGVSIISHRPVAGSDLKQERSFFRRSVSKFLQLVVTYIVFGIICHYEHNFDVFCEKRTATIICTFG